MYDAETPRKNSYSGKFKNINTSAKRHSPSEKYFQKSSSCANYLDLESLQSFPTLSSCSSTKMENNDKKFQESASNNFVWENSNNESTDKRLRQVKLFSETLEENLIGNESFKKDMEYLEDAFSKCGNKILISTPKPLKNDSLPDADNSDKLDLWNTSPKSTSKPSSISNNSEITTSEINSLNFKSRIFGDDTSQKNKNKKTGYRRSLGDFTSCDLNIAAKNKKEKKGKTKKRINPTKASNSLSFNSSSLQDKSVEFLHGSDNTSALNFSFENQTQESFTKKDAEINKVSV